MSPETAERFQADRLELSRQLQAYRELSQSLMVSMSQIDRLATRLQVQVADSPSQHVVNNVMALDLPEHEQSARAVQAAMTYLDERSSAKLADIHAHLQHAGLTKNMTPQRLQTLLNNANRFKKIAPGRWALAGSRVSA